VANPTINLPVGTYRIELTVNNGQADSAPATLTFTVGSGASKASPAAIKDRVQGLCGRTAPDWRRSPWTALNPAIPTKRS
jgi:hypothetical protein